MFPDVLKFVKFGEQYTKIKNIRLNISLVLEYIKHVLLLKKLQNTPMVINENINIAQNDTRFRSDDGTFTNLQNPYIGTSGQPFGRYIPIIHNYELYDPTPSTVADVFFTRYREKYVPGANLFVASWIQFMIHDWFNHVLDNNKCLALKSNMNVDATTFYQDAYTLNENSHFWDGSQIYKDSLRKKDGSGHLLLNDNYIPIKNNLENTGFNDNMWFGLALLHLLFIKEHNYICDRLKEKYNKMSDDELYGTSRLIVCGLIAKIHTVEWTKTILQADVTTTGQDTFYYGIFGKKIRKFISKFIDFSKFKIPFSDILLGVPKGHIKDDNVNFSIIEEFTSIYKMHSLLPDSITLHSLKNTDKKILYLKDTLFYKSKNINTTYNLSDLMYSIGKSQVCSLDLNNYPNFLRNLQIPNHNNIDLAISDILRDRERNVPRYNDFRRGLGLSTKKFEDITTDNTILENLIKIYDNDVEKIDLMVGTHLEEKMPNCIFGETIYAVFILQTFRRMSNDRFYTTNYNATYYTQFGIDHIDNNTFKTLLLRHYPDLGDSIGENGFLLFN